jgi:hypothetical protein
MVRTFANGRVYDIYIYVLHINMNYLQDANMNRSNTLHQGF